MLDGPQPPRIYLPTDSQAGVTDVSSHNLRKTFANRLLSRGAFVTDVQNIS